jgi:hypothetical protein
MFGGILRVSEKNAKPKKETKKAILKKYAEECREILADVSLSADKKVAAIKNFAEFYAEKLIYIDSSPENIAWEKRDSTIMRKYYPKRGTTICCPHCGEFYPKRPPEANANDNVLEAVLDRKTAELVRKVLHGKAA